MRNPWGRSGSDMNPWLRIAIVLGTGLATGLSLPWVFERLPLWAAVLLGVTLVLVAAGFLIDTMLFLRQDRQQMEKTEEFLKSIEVE